jgi:uncharacterized protein
MKKSVILIVTSLMMLVVLAACQAAPAAANPYYPTRQLMAAGQGKVYLTPDIAYISLGVHSQSENVSDSLKENNAKAQSIAEALKAQGIDPKDIQTSSFNITPQQQFGPQGESTGQVLYMVDNIVNVTVRDLTKLGSLLDVVVTSGANSVNNIQFDVQNKEEAAVQARKIAIDNAKKQAVDIAKEAGIELGQIASVNVSSGPVPVPMFEGKGGAAVNASVPISAGQMVITVDANITYDIK